MAKIITEEYFESRYPFLKSKGIKNMLAKGTKKPKYFVNFEMDELSSGVLFATKADMSNFLRVAKKHGWDWTDILTYKEYKKLTRNPCTDKTKKKKNPCKTKTKKNPPLKLVRTKGVEIYDTILAIEARKGKNSLWPEEDFRHDFKVNSKASVIGLSDGSILIKSKCGKNLWKNFNYPGRERK